MLGTLHSAFCTSNCASCTSHLALRILPSALHTLHLAPVSFRTQYFCTLSLHSLNHAQHSRVFRVAFFFRECCVRICCVQCRVCCVVCCVLFDFVLICDLCVVWYLMWCVLHWVLCLARYLSSGVHRRFDSNFGTSIISLARCENDAHAKELWTTRHHVMNDVTILLQHRAV